MDFKLWEVEKKAHSYRWVILAFYFVITVGIQIQWLAFASISEISKEFYHVSTLGIDFLSIIYMVVFIVLSLPASYIIDKYGLKEGLLIGAYLTGVFGLLKGFGGSNYTLVVIAQFGLAVAQPFILNALTKLGALWFPPNERATAAGIGTLAQYIGIIIALAVTPLLINKEISGFGIQHMLEIYGVFCAVSALLVIILVKDPPTEAVSTLNPDLRLSPERSILYILKNRDMQLLLILFFIGLGIFNAVSTCIDQITSELTMKQTGLVGGITLIGGIIGAIIFPIMSDNLKKRQPFIFWCMLLMLPGIAGLAFFHNFVMLLISGFVFGFFIMSAGPIAFQYGAEASYPATESLSQGLLLMAGQISGILFVIGLNSVGAQIAMIVFIVLTIINVLLSTRLKESYRELPSD